MFNEIESWEIVLSCSVHDGYELCPSTSSSDIRGSVTDQSGALIPGVTVTVLNVDTGISKDFVTNRDGLYDTSSIVTGRYQLTFTKRGIRTACSRPHYSRRRIHWGERSVEGRFYQSAGCGHRERSLLNTESGEQETTLEAKTMAQLPNVGTDWQNFTILLPGTSGSPSGVFGSANPGQFVAANGNLPYNAILSDGSVTTLPSSSNSEVSTFETVAEIQVSTSNFSAQYGIGGYVFNQVSKSGTDHFHGAVYEISKTML